MDALEYYLKYKIYITHIFELIAALAGSYYIIKNKNTAYRFKLFAWYLWFVLIADLFGFYSIWNYFDNYQTFPWLQDSPYARNEWFINCLIVISYVVESLIFIASLTASKIKNILKAATLFYSIFGVVEILFIGDVFKEYIIINIFLGTLLLLSSIAVYFQQLLKSDKILYFSKDLLFYIAIGVVIWNLCVTPIYIYDDYFNTENEEFILLYAAILRYCNIFMYSAFAVGFVVCVTPFKKIGIWKKPE